MSAAAVVDDDARILLLAKTHPMIMSMLEQALVDSYEKFVEVFYKRLALVLSRLQERKQFYFDATEDQITIYVVDLLKERGYNAEHDPKIGGHIDILVRGKDGTNYLWAGEAKRDNQSLEWFEKGFRQLVQRYLPGGKHQDCGGLIIYAQAKPAVQRLKSWKGKLESICADFDGLDIDDSTLVDDVFFNSTHIHETSGRECHVRHFAVGLFHSPTV